MKITKSSNLFDAIKPLPDDRIIPYIEKWLVTSPNAGLYQVDDRPYKTRNPDRATMNFHPSGDCLKCERLLYYERDVNAQLVDSPPDAGLQAIFKMGDATHAMIQAWFAAMSELTGFPQLVENEMRIEGGCFEPYGVGGYIDSVIRFPGSDAPIAIEIKSINDYGFNRLNGPKPEHRLQVGCYIAYLESPFGIVLYYNKNTSAMKEFRVEPVDLSNVLMRWANVRVAVASGSPDGLAYGCSRGTKPNDKTFEWCSAKDICARELLMGGASNGQGRPWQEVRGEIGF